jgi:integrase
MRVRDRGLFHRKGSPNWWIRYSDDKGRIVRLSTGTIDKNLAKKILSKRKVQVAEGRHLDIKKVPRTTFFQLCDEWWELQGTNKRMNGLSNMVECWKTFFGDVPVTNITQHTVEKFLIEKINNGPRILTPATRNRHLAHLSSMFNKGIEWGLIVGNPASAIKLLKENGSRTRFLDKDEISKLLNSATIEFHPVLMTALHTGMRKGEILKLKWADVDFQNGIITVQESKSGRRRMIPLNDTLLKTLKVLPSRFEKGFVFPSPVKKGQPQCDFKRQFSNTLARSGIEDFRFHDLRHTFASHLVMNGVDLLVVKELLGHASLTMTMRYAHLAPEHRSRAIKTLDTAYESDTKSDTAGQSGGS